MVTLVIAEKPSVARDIARVLGASGRKGGYIEGAGYAVSWCVGHLLELQEPHQYDPGWKQWTTRTLPMIPPTFKTRPRKGSAKQLGILRGLARRGDVDHVVNACDAGREGELIFRYVWDAIGPRRGAAPRISRLWISSLTDRAIREGFGRLQDGQRYDRLADAARSRSEADWLVGLNATRAMTLLGRRGGARQALLSVGRVQTPTLAMLTGREDAIESFEPKTFWQVRARFEARAGTFEARFTKPGGGKHPDRLETSEQAQAVARGVAGETGRIVKVTHDRIKRRPPALYDLTTLQKTANRRFGMSAKRTLAAAQALYERHKAITYPRTDARFLTADVAAKLPSVVRRFAGGGAWARIAEEAVSAADGPRPRRRIVNPAEVGDHHAILPTGKLLDSSRLGGDEQRIYDLVVRRLLAVFLPDAVFAKTVIETQVGPSERPLDFVCTGTTRLEQGWQLAEPASKKRSAEDDAPPLPRVEQGDSARVLDVKVTESQTQPPKRYTEATLLAGMETAGKQLEEDELRRAMRSSGLGTPATRAAIIETLLARDYMRRDGRALVPTGQGRALIAALPVPALRSAELTGRWEAELSEMAEGRGDRRAFMGRIAEFTAEVVKLLRQAEPPEALAKAAAEPKEAIGRCPICGQPVRENQKAYACDTGRDCSFVIFKSIAKKKISPNLVRVLLSRGRSQKLKGFRSKAGKPFSTVLVLQADGTVAFDFGAGKAKKSAKVAPSKAQTTGPAPTPPSSRGGVSAPRQPSRPVAATKSAPVSTRYPLCPSCKRGRIIRGRHAWGCSAFRDGCDVVVPFVQGSGQITLPDDEADRLFRKKQTRLMDGLLPDKKARLVLDLSAPGNVRIEATKRGSGRRPRDLSQAGS